MESHLYVGACWVLCCTTRAGRLQKNGLPYVGAGPAQDGGLVCARALNLIFKVNARV